MDAFKRPLSSMTPTFVEDERGVLVLGTPGGSRIISMVLLGILDYVDGARPTSSAWWARRVIIISICPIASSMSRVHSPAARSRVCRAKGTCVQEGRRRWGNMQAVYVKRSSGEATAHSDPRSKGGALF